MSEQFKVFYAVVSLCAILMVYVLTFLKPSANSKFHYKPMLSDSPSFVSYKYVSKLVHAPGRWKQFISMMEAISIRSGVRTASLAFVSIPSEDSLTHRSVWISFPAHIPQSTCSLWESQA